MRKLVGMAGIAGLLVAAACNSKDAVMSSDLKKDLDAASTSTSIDLATSQTPANQVVSAIERTTPPAPRKVASSQRVAKHKAAPKGVPAPVQVKEADVSAEVEAQPVEVAPAPVDPAPLPSPRPQPVASTGGGDREGRAGGGGSNIGSILGGIFTVVIRGGGVDGDQCDPRTDGRHGGNTAINNRLPPGTFPGSGRIGGGNFPTTGRGVGGPIGRGRGRF